MRQPAEPLIQWWLFTCHLTAFAIATGVASTHLAAMVYHLNRARNGHPETQNPLIDDPIFNPEPDEFSGVLKWIRGDA